MGCEAAEARETGPSRAFASDAPICHNSTFGLTPIPSDQGKTLDLMRAILLLQRRNDQCATCDRSQTFEAFEPYRPPPQTKVPSNQSIALHVDLIRSPNMTNPNRRCSVVFAVLVE
jgi:hypothetical protein